MLKLIDTTPLVVDKKTSVLASARKMHALHASCLLVHDKHQQIIGIVTRGDMVAALEQTARQSDTSAFTSARIVSLMTSPVEFVYYPSLVADMLRLQDGEEIEHFPLLRTHGPPSLNNLVGVITLANIGRRFFASVPQLVPNSLI